MYTPFKMKGKSPMMKALIGKQANLPPELKAKIQASPTPIPMKKASSMKMKKESSMKMMKKSPAKKAMNTNAGDTLKSILEPGIVKLNRALGKETISQYILGTRKLNQEKIRKEKGSMDLAPKSDKDKKFDKQKGTGKNLIVNNKSKNALQPKKKKVTFAEAYKKRDMKTYGNQTLSEYTKEAKRQNTSKAAGKGYDAPKSQMKGSVVGPKTKDTTPKKEVKTTTTTTKTTPKVTVKKPKTVKEARAARKLSKQNVRATRKKFGRGSAEVKAAKTTRKAAKQEVKTAKGTRRAVRKVAKKTNKAVKRGTRDAKAFIKEQMKKLA